MMTNSLGNKKNIIIYISLLFSIVISGCAPRIAIREGYDFTKINRIGVLDFVNYLDFENSGNVIADEFVRQLLSNNFDIVERSRLYNILQEKRIIDKEIPGPSSIKKIGKILGADVLITGTVTKFLPEHKNIVYVKDENGIEKWDIIVFDAEVAISARMIDVDTGLVVWSGSYSYESFDIENAVIHTVSRLLAPFYKMIR